MIFIDTHTHLYLDNFSDDREIIIQNAINQGVEKMLFPAIDSSTFESMMELTGNHPDNCFPMIGLHPTSVKDDYEDEIKLVEEQLQTGKFIAVGEIGIDLYWDKTHFEEQKDAFRRQLRLAKKYKLPVAIHTRDSFDDIFSIVKEEKTDDLMGVFHCFTGTLEESEKIVELGFSMGIGGIVTFKNAGLAEVVTDIPLENLILETDSPFLTPTPHRGKRNESSYIPLIAKKLAEVKNISIEQVAEITTNNAKQLFKLL